MVYLVYSAIKLLNNRGQKFIPGAGKGPEGMEKARPTSVHQKLYTVSGCVTCQKSDKSFLGILFESNFSHSVSKILQSSWYLMGKKMGMLNYYPTTPSPDQRVMFVSPIRFILDGKYFASMMTSIKENAFEI